MKRQNRKWKAFTLIGPKDHDRAEGSWREQLHKRGFTLIELIVVMAVIGILVLLAAPKFLGYTQRAQETKHIHTAKVIETALEAYLINGGAFPDDLEVVDKSLLEESAGKESLIGVNGYVTTIDEETYYELTYDFIQKLDVKLSAKNQLFVEALASSVPTAVYASEKGIAFVDKEKTMKGYELKPDEIPNEIDPNSVKQLVSGAYHSMVLLEDGSVFTWGFNVFGQLGDGTTINKSTPVKVQNLQSSVKIIAAGMYNSMALLEDGSVLAWGWNNYGQLGDGTLTDKSIPIKVKNLPSPVKAIAVGDTHTLALLEDNTIWAWGYNGRGQLGDDSTTNRIIPVKVRNLSSPIKSISAGYEYSMALMEDGNIMSWGYNNFGQLGDGTTTNRRTPVKVQTSSPAKALAAGGSHSMALLEDGSVMAWGLNDRGQLGDSSNSARSTPVKVKNLSSSAKVIAIGGSHSMALLEDNTIWAWGYNVRGQLGDGTTTNRNTPVQVKNLSSSAKSIAAGYSHSMVFLEDNSLMTWGLNNYGQLGNGNTEDKSTPTLIPLP